MRVFIFCVLTSCATVPTPLPQEYLYIGRLVNERVPDLGGLASVFEDGTEIDEVYFQTVKGQHYLVRKGYTESKDCIVTRSLLTLRNNRLLLNRAGVTESCKGVGCSQCGFKTTGGCECLNSTNVCEHTISRNNWGVIF